MAPPPPFTSLPEDLSFTEMLTSCLPESCASMSLLSHILQEGICGTTSNATNIHSHPSCSSIQSNCLHNLCIPQDDLTKFQCVHPTNHSSYQNDQFGALYAHATSSHFYDSTGTVSASAWPRNSPCARGGDEASKPSTSSATSEPSSTLESMDACDFATLQKLQLQPSCTGDMRGTKEAAHYSCQTSLDEGSSMINVQHVNMVEDASHTSPQANRSVDESCCLDKCRTSNNVHRNSAGAGDCTISSRPAASKRKRSKVCKNSEEAESQRMTHIAVERNRRRQMNEHLSALRSLMPAAYLQKGDQASIIGGAINFVKELEHVLQGLVAQKNHRNPQDMDFPHKQGGSSKFREPTSIEQGYLNQLQQGKDCNPSNAFEDKFTHVSCEGVEVDVRLIGTSAFVKVLAQKIPHQLLKVAFSVESLHMKIMHLNVTTLDKSVLYSFNLEVEGGSQFQSANGIAQLIQRIFRVQK